MVRHEEAKKRRHGARAKKQTSQTKLKKCGARNSEPHRRAGRRQLLHPPSANKRSEIGITSNVETKTKRRLFLSIRYTIAPVSSLSPLRSAAKKNHRTLLALDYLVAVAVEASQSRTALSVLSTFLSVERYHDLPRCPYDTPSGIPSLRAQGCTSLSKHVVDEHSQ